jgi:hypothetical protein
VCVHKHGGQWDGQACTVYQYLSRASFRLAQHSDGTWSVVKPPPSQAQADAGQPAAAAAAAAAAATDQEVMNSNRDEPEGLIEFHHEEATGSQTHELLRWHRIGLWGGQRGEPAFMPLHAEYAPHISLLHARDPALLAERIRGRVYVGVRSADRMYTVGCVLVALGCLVLGAQVAAGVLAAFRVRKAAAGRPRRTREQEEEEEQVLTMDELGKLVGSPNMRVDVECF